MASLLPESPDCFADAPLLAQDVARGVTRLFFRGEMYALCEVPLPNGRRADLMAIDPRGQLIIVEIKVSRADLMADCKWADYLCRPLAGARRKAETLRFARRAARRLAGDLDPGLAGLD